MEKEYCLSSLDDHSERYFFSRCMQSQLSHAVLREDFEEAGRLKVAIAAASRRDAVGRAMFYLKV